MPLKPNTVDQYLQIGCGRCEFGGTPHCKVLSWEEELRQLRAIIQQSPLQEEIKWGAPCYTYRGKNVLTLSALKETVVVSFFRGAQLPDPENILEKPGPNSRFARYIRFTDIESIAPRKSVILDYIAQAIAIENSGEHAAPKTESMPESPEELQEMFTRYPDFAAAFAALTPGRQRGYLIHFSSAKQAKTRLSRIEKSMSKIFQGKGWNER